MEDRLSKIFESIRADGVIESDIKKKLFGDTSGKVLLPDYILARCHGLSIAEAEFAALLAQELRQIGPESLLMRLDGCKETYNQNYYHRKRNKKNRAGEPELKKKSKH